MAKVRKYSKSVISFEMQIFEGSKLVLHCIYYPSRYNVPRYHFENFGLILPDYNYEIGRFIQAVNKYEAYPKLDLESLDMRLNWPRGFFEDD